MGPPSSRLAFPLLLLLLLHPAHARPNNQDDLHHENDALDDSQDSDTHHKYDERYIGHCKTAMVNMWPGNSRKFWSYGYMYLKEPYLANCTLKYVYNTRALASDPIKKFGFRVTGSFTGPNVYSNSCSDTDYVYLDDTAGVNATYCGPYSTINFVTGSDYFEFHFVSKENSPRAKGFFVVIESFFLCGGSHTHLSHGPSGVISSPLHTQDYPANVACTWMFTTLDMATIRLTCSSFVLEGQQTVSPGSSSCVDYLSFTYEAGSSSETTTYCDTELATLNRHVYSSGKSLLLSFRSDSLNHFQGFKCTYEFIKYAE